MKNKFEAVFFDLGGTLRIMHKDIEYSNRAKRKLAELLGVDSDPYEFCKFLDYRYEGYRKWSLDTMKEAAEVEQWTRWLTPDFPKDEITAKAVELTYQYRMCAEGRRELVESGREVIAGLQQRGYTLGIISNLTSTVEIPEWLEKDGLAPYFKTVVLSPVLGIRKPDPAIYIEASQRIGIPPEKCVYIGDNLDRDVAGSKKAGFGMNIIIISPEKLEKKKITDENRPDAIIHEFKEILDIFPKCPEVNFNAIRKP
jgi:HAD superfamily hydrolase (TIGR01549 family)